MRIADLSGIVAILPTPLTRERQVDEAGVRHLVAYCADEGLDGAVVLGSTGEFPYLSFEEKCRVMAVAAETGGGRIPVIGSASAHGTNEAVALARAARDAGCDAVLATLPLYYALDLAAVERHFETLAREGGVPVFFYYFREVAGLALKPRARAEIEADVKALRAKRKEREPRGVQIVACPTCGRVEVDVVSLAAKVEELARDLPADRVIAVMGCVVNGPGEAKAADLGIAAGKSRVAIFRHGELYRNIAKEDLEEVLLAEIERLR